MIQTNISTNASGIATLQISRPTIAGTFVSVFRNEGGLPGLYKGLTPTLLAMVNFYYSLSFEL